jgi:hypothetical protein
MAHMLFNCPRAISLWNSLRKVWSVQCVGKFVGPQETWLEEMLLALPKNMLDRVIMVMWCIWFVRNEITHDKPLSAVEGSRRFLCSYMASLENSKKLPTEEILKGKRPMHQPVVISEAPVAVESWKKPPIGYVKLNVDGSFMVQDGAASAGVIVGASDGSIILSACKVLNHCCSALEAELRAVIEGVSLVRVEPIANLSSNG